eukprot:TRINITY_DN47688_c0_g1_i1.p1 TRINITY_DN47688_c0_g1~~TRINITY_DN47688_c0_g1_i1.p1  ORF type:complete len:120 (-),score=8.95 TRINITY_DN47688_c0_g1_i1:372-731(-)
MAVGKWLLLSRLRKAIQKVRFLLSFKVHKWHHLMSFVQSPSRRQLSFNDPPGLLDCTNSDIGLSPVSIRRTLSDVDDDIDRRAQAFIDNFHRHIQMERQVSLELRYAARNGGLQRTSSD